MADPARQSWTSERHRDAAALSPAWLVDSGQREAKERLAHLLNQIHARLESIGLAKDGRFLLPLNYSDLVATPGMSDVHLNRALQALRSEGLVARKQKRAGDPGRGRLRAVAGFNPNYLHLSSGKKD